jgi:hypothetical protein
MQKNRKELKTSRSWCNESGLYDRFKLKTFICGSRNSHVNACTSTKQYAHSSYAHIVLQMSITHWVKFEQNFMPKSWTNAYLALFPRGGANKSASSPPTHSCVDPLPFILDNEDEKGKNRDDNGHYPFTLVLDLTCCW